MTSEFFLLTLLIAISGLAFYAQLVARAAGSTIYIRSDGSVDPPTDILASEDNITYTITRDFRGPLYVERSGIRINGNGCRIGALPGPHILLRGTSNVTIENTIIYDIDECGIKLEAGCANSVIRWNKIECHVCIRLISCSNITILENEIAGAEGGVSTGIHATESSYLRISKNDIRGYTGPRHPKICIGIALSRNTTEARIFENNLSDNRYGIRLENSSSNEIFNNNFINNTKQVLLKGDSNNSWDNGAEGNYWSDYMGIDSDHDGLIGDTPYIIDTNNIDHYPFICPLGAPPRRPVANFTFSPPLNLSVAQAIIFNASLSDPQCGYISNYIWDFGDGNVTSTIDPVTVHSYETPNVYNVALTVYDSEGLNSSCFFPILVMMPTYISISTSSPSTFLGFSVDINGTLRNFYDYTLKNKNVVLYYIISGSDTFIPIASDVSDNYGHFSISWIPPATGYFTIKAEWEGNETHSIARNTIILSSLSYQNKYIFSVESNSTISTLNFNSTARELSFKASGLDGTKGYIKVTFARSLVADMKNINVYVDDNQLEYAIMPQDNSWVILFTYEHSTHNVKVNLGKAQSSFIETPLVKAAILAGSLSVIVLLVVIFILRRHK